MMTLSHTTSETARITTITITDQRQCEKLCSQSRQGNLAARLRNAFTKAGIDYRGGCFAPDRCTVNIATSKPIDDTERRKIRSIVYDVTTPSESSRMSWTTRRRGASW